jgi:DNA polymerase elongation subunit (family B)
MKFYTNFTRLGKFIVERGYKDGKRFTRKTEYTPTLYVPSREVTDYTTLQGDYVAPIKFEGMREATDFTKNYEGVDNFAIYGSTNFAYTYIDSQYPDGVDYDVSLIRTLNIDIEVGSENGFPEPAQANEPITAITIKTGGHYYVLGCGEYTNARKDVTYTQCNDENQLIMKFLELWESFDADIITGWNVKFFDMPYLHNRIVKLAGENTVKRLSPLRAISQRTTKVNNREQVAYEFEGIVILDYLELYKKFTYSQQESYQLDHIAFVELGERKLDYSEYENLHQLYKLDYQKFIEYNIKDVDLVDRIEDKMKLIEMVLALAYDAKVNLNDVFTQVRMWDTLTHNHLMTKKIVVPQKKNSSKDEQFEGAYVKDPIIGKHEWVASFDLNSLYPHLIMQYNLSPETLVEGMHTSISVDNLLNSKYEANQEYCMAANGHYFRKDKQGFLPEMMQTMYDDRSKYKKLMIEWQKKKEAAKTDEEKFECEKRISKYKNLQMAKKVQLNSAYGALGNQYFRFYDIRQAEAITLSGQLSIRWIEQKMNGYLNNLLKTDGVDYIIASDTDSIYVHFGPLVKKVYGDSSLPKEKIVDFLDRVCEQKIQPFIDKSYQQLADYMNAFDQKMQMKRESIADTGIWTAKKRYILNVWDNEGVRYAEPKLKMMGIESVKSSTPRVCRDKFEAAFKLIMTGTEGEFQQFNDQFRQEFRKMKFEDVAFPRGISDLTKYKSSSQLYEKGTPIHVRGAIMYNHLLTKKNLTKKYQLIKDGEKIKFCYMKTPNPMQENVLSVPNVLPKEFDFEKYIDYDLQFEKSYLEPLQIIVEKFGWSAEKKSNLMGFFQ